VYRSTAFPTVNDGSLLVETTRPDAEQPNAMQSPTPSRMCPYCKAVLQNGCSTLGAKFSSQFSVLLNNKHNHSDLIYWFFSSPVLHISAGYIRRHQAFDKVADVDSRNM